MGMTPRDKELALQFIHNAKHASVAGYAVTWEGSVQKVNCYDFSYNFVNVRCDPFTYDENKGLWYNDTPLWLSFWMRCRVYWAAKRLAEYGDQIKHDTYELSRQKKIAQ